ncbi:hypothetical protein G8O30_12385 [Mangrovibacillus cuniculi]|uniref:VanZ-like domain-containing protein n=1 Tax=Mangrovibacillus cuniculi TaxID=2593652 RepID=A0A7S8CEF5_9BACI|nr:hypothetical protein G8O30_12385 [Mangrovibacillus cuniculi]
MIKWGVTILPFLYMVFIWHLSSRPADAYVYIVDDGIDGFIKESLHLIEFAILYIVSVLALAAHGKLTAATSLLVACLSCFYGFIDEIHQSFVPYRSATLIDAVKDVIGVVVAWSYVSFTHFRKKPTMFSNTLLWMEKNVYVKEK